MPKVQSLQHGVGRPKKPSGHVKLSKTQTKCWSCSKVLRKDKLIEHIRKTVVWSGDPGTVLKPADRDDFTYVSASEITRKHTDDLREK